jgi:hypothetical protein
MQKPMEYYVHHVPGRLRVRIPEIRNSMHLAGEVKRVLDVYGVDSVKVNPLTGSVVATFDSGLTTADQLLGLLNENGMIDPSRTIGCDETIQRASTKAASKFGRVVFGYAVGRALEASGFPLLAALI